MTQKILFTIILLATSMSCTHIPHDIQSHDILPEIYPDYIDVTIPPSIAPLNFEMEGEDYDMIDVTIITPNGNTIHSNGKTTDFDIEEWHYITRQAQGDTLKVSVLARSNNTWNSFKDFFIYVSRDSIHAYGLTYRRIEPGYKIYDQMGIYQRNISNFKETPIFQNSELYNACVNCHTANRGSNKNFVFHMRGPNSGTVISNEEETHIINGKNDNIIGSFVYPSWHPEGRFIACSSNETRQTFHLTHNKRIEVFDRKSDIFIYDTHNNNIITSPLLNMTDSILETFPNFSADGKKLYFCTAQYNNDEIQDLRYCLCSIDFDAEKQTFGSKIDTIVDMRDQGLSISHPRTSPDQRFIMFTTCNYGTFPIWHKEADLWILNLCTNEIRRLDTVNSDNTESFHNWSNDSRWFVFSSRREDGLFTRLYIAHCDENGICSKPFLLPQRTPKEYYSNMFDSYNTPDFSIGPVVINPKTITNEITSSKILNVK